jgi:hypothetical protein
MFFFGGQELRQGFPSTPEVTSNHFFNLNCEGVGVEGIWDWRFRHKQVEDDEYTRGDEFSVIVHLYC